MSATINGIPAQAMDGFAPLYQSSGLIPSASAPRMFVAQVVTATNGTWTLNISAAGFPTVAYAVGTTAISTGTGSQAMFIPVVLTSSLTSITGTVVTPTNSVIGTLPFVAAAQAVTFNILVIGW